MPILSRSTLVWLLVLPACARPTASTNPEAGQYDDYYSEQPGGGGANDGGSGSGSQGSKKAKPMMGTGATSAKVPKRIRAKRPVAKTDKPPAEVPDAGDVEALELRGILPSTASIGSYVELIGAHLDTPGLVVKKRGKVQKIISQEPNRIVFQVAGPESGPIAVGTEKQKKFTAATTTQTPLEVLKKDVGFGQPRTEIGHGLIGNIYAIDKEVNELPAFDTLGAPVGTIAVDNLDIPSYSFQQKIGGRKERFGIHFRGFLNVVEEGNYAFCLAAGSGALLFLDGTDVVDNDGAHPTEEQCTEFFVEAGEYQLDLLWHQGKIGELGLTLSWSKDGGPKKPVPTEAFFPPEDMYDLVR